MHSLGAIDLNLVVALHALLEERAVTGAARRVGLSQPAMSHALARLRAHFGDPLLVRDGRRMVPTPRGIALLPAVRKAVVALEGVWRVQTFDAAALQITFRVVTDDAVGTLLLPRLIANLAGAAPGVELDVLPRGAPGRKALVRAGTADVALGDFSEAGMDLHRTRLYEDVWVSVVRGGHPLPVGADPATWAACNHLIVSPTGGRRGVVDTALERQGLSRRVSVAGAALHHGAGGGGPHGLGPHGGVADG